MNAHTHYHMTRRQLSHDLCKLAEKRMTAMTAYHHMFESNESHRREVMDEQHPPTLAQDRQAVCDRYRQWIAAGGDVSADSPELDVAAGRMADEVMLQH